MIMPTASIWEMTAFCSLGLVICSLSLSFQSFVVMDCKPRNVSPISQVPVAGSDVVSTLIPLAISPSVLLA